MITEKINKLIEKDLEKEYKVLCRKYKKIVDETNTVNEEDINKLQTHYAQLKGYNKAVDVMLGQQRSIDVICEWFDDVMKEEV